MRYFKQVIIRNDNRSPEELDEYERDHFQAYNKCPACGDIRNPHLVGNTLVCKHCRCQWTVEEKVDKHDDGLAELKKSVDQITGKVDEIKEAMLKIIDTSDKSQDNDGEIVNIVLSARAGVAKRVLNMIEEVQCGQEKEVQETQS